MASLDLEDLTVVEEGFSMGTLGLDAAGVAASLDEPLALVDTAGSEAFASTLVGMIFET